MVIVVILLTGAGIPGLVAGGGPSALGGLPLFCIFES
jgi:hypothetical protein